MRTHEPDCRHQPTVLIAGPPYERRTQRHQPRHAGVTDADEEASRARLAGLIQEHRDLDGAIAVLFDTITCDGLLIARLKKRKLQLKDAIVRIAG